MAVAVTRPAAAARARVRLKRGSWSVSWQIQRLHRLAELLQPEALGPCGFHGVVFGLLAHVCAV